VGFSPHYELIALFIALLPGTLRKHVENRDVIAMHARQVRSNRLDLVSIEMNQIDHVDVLRHAPEAAVTNAVVVAVITPARALNQADLFSRPEKLPVD
jgi:hypothetical protein